MQSLPEIRYPETRLKDYLFVSDFDQTLSFNDSGFVLSELIGVSGFTERIPGLSKIHLVQQGGELAYLLLHDPEFRRVRREHLYEVGKRIRLKQNIALLPELLADLDGHRFTFYVVSAAPQEVIQSALEGVVPRDHISAPSFTTIPAARSSLSCACPLDTAKWRWWTSCERTFHWAMIASSMWATAAPMFMS